MKYNKYLVEFYLDGNYYNQVVSGRTPDKAEDFVIMVYSKKGYAVEIIKTTEIKEV